MLDPRNPIAGGRIGYSHIDRQSLARKQMRAQAACLVDIVPCNCFQDAAILRENGIGAGTDLGLTHFGARVLQFAAAGKELRQLGAGISADLPAEALLNHFADVTKPHFIGRGVFGHRERAHPVAGSYQRKLTWNCLLGEALT